MSNPKKILIIGGAGYVGSQLTPLLLNNGYSVGVLDLFIYGEDVLKPHVNLDLIKCDVRNLELLKKYFPNYDTIIHLACISNDPSFELNPELSRSINLECFEPMVKIAINSGINRFIYASSSSVYGVKKEQNVTEEMSLEPLTDYSKFKAQCEEILLKYTNRGFNTCIVRPATVCGYSPRQRLDVVVNILTTYAYYKNEINVLGGNQLRPNINIFDMCNLYLELLKIDSSIINGNIYNAGYQNHSVLEIANMIKEKINKNNIIINLKPTNDNRSYHICSDKIFDELNFINQYTVEDAIDSLTQAFNEKKLVEPLNNELYYNIKRCKT